MRLIGAWVDRSAAMTLMTDDVRAIREAGWRQGSIMALPQDGDTPEGYAPDLAVLLTHDCDLFHPSFDDEPRAEFVGGLLIDAPDGNFTYGKNPRRLQVALQGERAKFVDLRARSWFELERRTLANRTPDVRWRLADEDRVLLARWASRRYERSAFPDGFNVRRSSSNSRVRRMLKRGGVDLVALYATLEHEEKAQDDPYVLIITGVTTRSVFDDAARRRQLIQLVDGIAAELSACDGIEVAESELQSEHQVTLEDLHLLAPLDEFDDLSSRD